MAKYWILSTFVICVLILVFAMSSKKNPKQKSFREMVTDPERMADSAARFQLLSELELPDDLDDDTIQSWVEELLSPEDRTPIEKLLKLAGDRAVPVLVKALKDPRFHQGQLGTDWFSPSPFERVLDLL